MWMSVCVIRCPAELAPYMCMYEHACNTHTRTHVYVCRVRLIGTNYNCREARTHAQTRSPWRPPLLILKLATSRWRTPLVTARPACLTSPLKTTPTERQQT